MCGKRWRNLRDSDTLRERLIADENKYGRASIAEHAKSDSLRERLLHDESREVRWAVAAYAESDCLKKKLQGDKDAAVRASALLVDFGPPPISQKALSAK